MGETYSSLVLRTGPVRLAAALAYSRLTGKPATWPQAPLQRLSSIVAPLPTGPWVRVRANLAGICGSDLKTLKLQVSTRSANQAQRRTGSGPIFLGHETTGVVTEAADCCSWARPGMRVVMVPQVSCEVLGVAPCAQCDAGLPLLCGRRNEASAQSGGGWSEQFVRHESQLFALGPDIPDELGVLFDPLGCALHCVLRQLPARSGSVLVIGAGTIGLAIVAMLRALDLDLRIAVLARHGFQARLAWQFGADCVVEATPEDAYGPLADFLSTAVLGLRRRNRMLDGGFDVVYDTVGSAATLHHALRWARPRGALVMEGVNQFPGSLDRTPLWNREITLTGAHGHGIETLQGRRAHTFEFVAEWIRTGKLAPAALLTHRLPFEAFREAIGIAADKTGAQSVKVVMTMGAA